MKQIVVIDDEIDFCVLVKMQCSKKDINCVYATSLDAGIELVQKVDPSVVILDNNLPDGLGWQKARQILQSHPHTVLHLITAKTTNDKTVKKMNGKEDETDRIFYHVKPLSLYEIEEILL
ncbi:response regulator [Chitinophagaceae bacterium LWZ2-11]